MWLYKLSRQNPIQTVNREATPHRKAWQLLPGHPLLLVSIEVRAACWSFLWLLVMVSGKSSRSSPAPSFNCAAASETAGQLLTPLEKQWAPVPKWNSEGDTCATCREWTNRPRKELAPVPPGETSRKHTLPSRPYSLQTNGWVLARVKLYRKQSKAKQNVKRVFFLARKKMGERIQSRAERGGRMARG